MKSLRKISRRLSTRDAKAVSYDPSSGQPVASPSYLAKKYEAEHPATQAEINIQRKHADNVCDRCSLVPWGFPDSYDEGLLIVGESVGELQGSTCRICRLLAKFFLMHGITSCPRVLEWRFDTNFEESYTNQGRSGCDSGYVGCITVRQMMTGWPPLIVVSRSQLEDSQSSFQDFCPQRLNFEKVKGYVQECESSHASCNLTNEAHLESLLLIDCERIVVVEAPVKCPDFVALSYVWGQPNIQLDAGKLDHWCDVPPTIQDSISVTKALGYKYLWVDQYCIDQDAESKHVQISQMGEIYAAASLTIIAATGYSPATGLPGIAPDSRNNVICHEALGSLCLTALPSIRGLEAVIRSKWATRAWTFQEGFLSRRRLIFTDRQCIFVCNSETHYETRANLTDGNFLARWTPRRSELRPEGTEPIERSMYYLEEYSRRDLSYDTDALDAIAGALNTLQKESVYHLSGVPYFITPGPTISPPKSYLALSWIHKRPARRRPEFPSWSPIGWSGEVLFAATLPNHNVYPWDIMHQDHYRYMCDASAISVCSAQSRKLYRPLSEYEEDASHTPRFLRLRLPSTRFQLRKHGDSYRIRLQDVDDPDLQSFEREGTWDVPNAELDCISSVTAIFMHASCPGIVREPIAIMLLVVARNNCYERIGIVADSPWSRKSMIGNERLRSLFTVDNILLG